MRRFLPTLLVLAAVVPSLTAAEPVVRRVEFDDAVTRVTANRLIEAIRVADEAGDTLVLVRLNTPGGYVNALEKLVQAMLNAKTPVVVWVGPAGSRAASAGFVMLIAADVAAMAPGTHTGAASVVSSLFGANPKDDVGLMKASNDMAARARSIAERRGRNVEACERAVLSADAFTDQQALAEDVIDLIAGSEQELLDTLDGREVTQFGGGVVTLRTAGATIIETEFTWRDTVLGIIANPAVAYLLLLVGLGGLYVELTHPGLIFPAVIGVLSLLMFAFAVQVLSVNAIGLLLILLAIVMFILEIKVTSYGMLTLGGTLCLLIGSIMLFPGPVPELRVPFFLVLPASLTIAGTCALAVHLAVKAQRAPVATGTEGLRGKVGIASTDLKPDGRVFIHGETWSAVTAGVPIERGARVRVVKVDDMLLTVEPADARRAEGG